MFAVGALNRALAMNEAVWHHDAFREMATKLRDDVMQGIKKHAVVERDGVQIYAYEVDGRGGVLADFDDANVPSLLATPLLGFEYDKQIYENTRKRLLTRANPFYFTGRVEGIGSAHTPGSNVWPMSMIMDALTTGDANRRVQIARMLLKSQCGNGVMHESINTDSLTCTRMWFEWANALFVVFHRHVLGEDCEAEARELQTEKIMSVEKSGVIPGAVPASSEDIRFYQPFAARIHQVRDEQPQTDWFTT
jgi:meiotically up-regulated gene 157 (Mug157) protein